MISTDYREQSNQNTFPSGMLQSYRLAHWFKDIIANFFSDPINIKDLRLCRLLIPQDGTTLTTLNSLYRVEMPYTKDTRKACTTPAVLVSCGATTYPIKTINQLPAAQTTTFGMLAVMQGIKHKTVDLNVAVITEDYDGTLLLTDILLAFISINLRLFVKDNPSIFQFAILGVSAPQQLQLGQVGNAKLIYQSVIQCRVFGGHSWTTDTQGPVFRGISIKANTFT